MESAGRRPPSSMKNVAQATISGCSSAAMLRSTNGSSSSESRSDTCETRARPVRARRSCSIDSCCSAARHTCSVTSTWTPTQCVTTPSASGTGEIETWFQKGTPSLR